MDDFTLIIYFIASVVGLIFGVLGSVHFGSFTILQIFISILLLRIFIWFVGRLLGTSFDTAIEESSGRAYSGRAYRNTNQKFKSFRYKSPKYRKQTNNYTGSQKRYKVSK